MEGKGLYARAAGGPGSAQSLATSSFVVPALIQNVIEFYNVIDENKPKQS